MVARNAERALGLMVDSDVMRYTLSEYVPSKRALSLLSLVDSDKVLRFAAFFSDLDGECARRELSALKSPAKLRNSVANVVDAGKKTYFDRESVAHLRSKLGDDAKSALELSIALGNSSCEVLALLNDQTPYDISQLAIGGRELSAIGYKGKEIGEELCVLLERVIADPALNETDVLLEIAKKDKDGR